MKRFFQERKFCFIFNAIAIAMFGVLFYYCLGLTGENSAELHDEYIYFKTDIIIWNVACIIAALICLRYIGNLSEKLKTLRARNILLAIVCGLAGAISLWWVFATKTAPQADQQMICYFADAFNKGDFAGLQKGEYVAIYPQQLGMITLLRVIFGIFGEDNYQAFQILNALLVPLLVLSGDKTVRILSKGNVRAELYYILFIFFCFPMYAYTSFVYGDLISIIVGLFSAWMFLSCLERFSWKKLVLFGLAIGLAVQLRENLLILAIAFGIALAIRLLSNRGWRSFAVIGALIIGVAIPKLAVWGIYHDVRPKDAAAIPASLFIVMGLNDDYQRVGWHNGYEISMFAELGCDLELAKEKAREDLMSYVGLYARDPDYMVDFFVRKMNAQWNAPMYQCVAMNSRVIEEQSPLVHSIFYHGRASMVLEAEMKIYQMLLYGSILFWLTVKRKENVHIEKYALLIAVFGGFLFSLMWEAKTRYVLPYFFMQIPYMAIGLEEIMTVWRQWEKKRSGR